jgi:acyl-CoA reductase-like NAD-dependent aldehyde dehydrogenase
MHRDMLYIGGSWTESKGEGRISVENPATGDVIGSVPEGTLEDADRAVLAAREAFGGWSSSPIEERIRVLNSLSESFKNRTA